MLFYIDQEYWKHEEVELLWAQEDVENIMRLVNAWLNFLQEERWCDKKITLECAIFGPNNHVLYCSFDRSPFAKQSILYKKWMWVESMFKTIRENGIAVPHIQFLV